MLLMSREQTRRRSDGRISVVVDDSKLEFKVLVSATGDVDCGADCFEEVVGMKTERFIIVLKEGFRLAHSFGKAAR
jgi:hypothetical protein